MAADLGIEFQASKGWVAGEEWDPESEFWFPAGTAPGTKRCKYLWSYAIVNNDGRVSACAASFFQEDDYGSVEDASFKQVWNNRSFREARRLFRSRSAAGGESGLICYDCPYTIVWENYQRHRAQHLPATSFDPAFTVNDWFNYFFNRRPGGRGIADASDAADIGPPDSRSPSDQD
jgi:hypothetical protein